MIINHYSAITSTTNNRSIYQSLAKKLKYACSKTIHKLTSIRKRSSKTIKRLRKSSYRSLKKGVRKTILVIKKGGRYILKRTKTSPRLVVKTARGFARISIRIAFGMFRGFKGAIHSMFRTPHRNPPAEEVPEHTPREKTPEQVITSLACFLEGISRVLEESSRPTSDSVTPALVIHYIKKQTDIQEPEYIDNLLSLYYKHARSQRSLKSQKTITTKKLLEIFRTKFSTSQYLFLRCVKNPALNTAYYRWHKSLFKRFRICDSDCVRDRNSNILYLHMMYGILSIVVSYLQTLDAPEPARKDRGTECNEVSDLFDVEMKVYPEIPTEKEKIPDLEKITESSSFLSISAKETCTEKIPVEEPAEEALGSNKVETPSENTSVTLEELNRRQRERKLAIRNSRKEEISAISRKVQRSARKQLRLKYARHCIPDE